MIYGVGYSEGSIHERSIKGVPTREYSLWYSMIMRCYSGHYPSYEGCIVDDRWLNFQNFCDDLPNLTGYEDWKDSKNRAIHLDKDSIIKGNRLYSKETCSFITQVENVRESSLRRWGTDPETYEPIRVGQRFDSVYGFYEVVEVVDSENVTIRFDNTGALHVGKSWETRNGFVSDKASLGYSLHRNVKYVKVGEIYPTDRSGDVEILEFFSPSQIKVKFLSSKKERVYSNSRILSGDIGDGTSLIKHKVNVGDIFANNYNQKCQILEYKNAVSIIVKFLDSGCEKTITRQRFDDGKFPDTSEIGQDFIDLYRLELNNKRKEIKRINIDLYKRKAPVPEKGMTKRERQVLEFVGQTFKTKDGRQIRVIEYISTSEIKYICLSTGNWGASTADKIRKGSLICNV